MLQVKRLEGLAEVCFLDVIWKYFYDTFSAKEHGTSYQLKNLINRTHITKPKQDFNACDDYFEIVMTGYISAAAMDTLAMDDLDATPAIPSAEIAWMENDDERKEHVRALSMQVVNKFINISFNKASSTSRDSMHDYGINLLSIGFLYLEMHDAIKEGDGDRVLQCWKYLLPIFHNSGRKHYTIEAFNLLLHFHYKLPPRLAAELKWSRFVNTQGRPGKNIPVDLHQEHLNRLVKTSIQSLGANKTETAVIIRTSRALGPLSTLLQQYDYYCSLLEESRVHQNHHTRKISP